MSQPLECPNSLAGKTDLVIVLPLGEGDAAHVARRPRFGFESGDKNALEPNVGCGRRVQY